MSDTREECRRFSRWLTPYVDSELDAVHTLEVEAHLESCDSCREQVALTEATRRSLRRISAEMRAPVALREKIIERLEREASSRQEALDEEPSTREVKPQLVKLRYVVPLAAAAALALVFGAMQVRQDTGVATGDRESSAGEKLRRAGTLDSMLEDMVLQHAHAVQPETTDPTGLERFEPYIGVRVNTPQLQSIGGQYLGARVTSRAAMLQYMLSNRHRVSLYVFDPKRVPIRSRSTLAPRRIQAHDVYVGRVRGYAVAASEQSGVGYVVASNLSDEKNTELLMLAAR